MELTHPDVFRRVMGHLASGVTIVTTRVGELDYGMTASSVTSLSLEPPMLVICLNNSAPTANAVAASGTYAISILKRDAAHLANKFAQPAVDKFEGVAVTGGRLGMPLLADALAHVECRVVEQVRGGTHTIFIGQAVEASSSDGDPLTYFRGGFGRFTFDRDDAAYARARTAVLNRRYRAGEVLEIETLASDLGTENSSAFYALTRLVSDGLVRREPDRGYVIVALDVRLADEAFDARTVIESGVAELTALHISADQLSGLRARFDAMAALLKDDRFVSFDNYLDANYAFHEFVVGLAQNSTLSSAFGHVGLRAAMARSFGATPVTSQSFVDVQRALVDAFEQRDVLAAKRAIAGYGELAKARVRELLLETGGQL